MWGRVLLVAFLVVASTRAVASTVQETGPIQRFDPTQDVGLDQRLGERLPDDVTLFDASGREVRIGELIAERPAVLALVYYDCPMLCGLVFDGLLRSLRAISLDVGADFDVVVVSIDPREGPELAAVAKERLVAEYGRPASASGWHALTGDEQQIRRLADAVGFRYAYDEASGEYAHAGGLVVVTPAGELSRYFYGVEYAPRDLRLALVEAADGRIGSLADQVLMLCLQWDPTTGRYGLAILSALRIAGVLTALGIAAFVAVMLRRELRGRAAGPTARPGAGVH